MTWRQGDKEKGESGRQEFAKRVSPFFKGRCPKDRGYNTIKTVNKFQDKLYKLLNIKGY